MLPTVDEEGKPQQQRFLEDKTYMYFDLTCHHDYGLATRGGTGMSTSSTTFHKHHSKLLTLVRSHRTELRLQPNELLVLCEDDPLELLRELQLALELFAGTHGIASEKAARAEAHKATARLGRLLPGLELRLVSRQLRVVTSQGGCRGARSH